MEQQQKAICLQLKADRGCYADQSELLADCAKFGASYIVAEWLDRYCADRGLYTENKGAKNGTTNSAKHENRRSQALLQRQADQR